MEIKIKEFGALNLQKVFSQRGTENWATRDFPLMLMTKSFIVDVNDNPPEFASKYYFATISEGLEIGTDVVRVMATSRDIGVNAEISYSIIGGNEHRKFTIDPITGLVSVSGEIDFERAKEYFLTIQARDGGSPPLSNHATVNVTIMDANDNAPIFTQVSYTATVNENSPTGAAVVTLTATDLDQVSLFTIKLKALLPLCTLHCICNSSAVICSAGRNACKSIHFS